MQVVLLTKRRRLTLIKNTLSNQPIYMISVLKMPMSVAKKIRNFLWGGGATRLIFGKMGKMLWAEKGRRIGDQDLIPFNQALLLKWNWRFANETTALWKEVMGKKIEAGQPNQ